MSSFQKSPDFDTLFCVPATIHLAGAEIELAGVSPMVAPGTAAHGGAREREFLEG
jgi:hypothetical protein